MQKHILLYVVPWLYYAWLILLISEVLLAVQYRSLVLWRCSWLRFHLHLSLLSSTTSLRFELMPTSFSVSIDDRRPSELLASVCHTTCLTFQCFWHSLQDYLRRLRLGPDFTNQSVFTMRCHASAVYALVVCLSDCHKSVFYWNG